MNKRILLGLLVVVLVITAIGVFAASSYKTTVSVTPITTTSNGDVLKVKVIMNYGPFGGQSSLEGSDVWLYSYNGTAYVFHGMNFTASNGVATFHVPPGKYKVLITDLHYSYVFTMSGSEEITVNYAYLYR